jgi:hypothetical protein
MNNEKPRVKTHLARGDAVRNARMHESTWTAGVEIELAVMNLSALPNVALGVKLTLLTPTGGAAAFPLKYSFADGKSAAFNLPPRTAEFRKLVVNVETVPQNVPTSEAWEKLGWKERLEAALGGPVVLQVEVLATDDRKFIDTIRL